jgi:Peptidase M50B-like
VLALPLEIPKPLSCRPTSTWTEGNINSVCTAVHEAGHAVAALVGGRTVTGIRLYNRAERWCGTHGPDEPNALMLEQLGGVAASLHYLRLIQLDTQSNRDNVRRDAHLDYGRAEKTLRRSRFHSVQSAEQAATVLVTTHWEHVERLAVRLLGAGGELGTIASL